MKQQIFLKFYTLLKQKMGILKPFLVGVGVGAMFGVFWPTAQHRKWEKQRAEERVQQFKDEARERVNHITGALNDIQEDLRTREDICAAHLTEDRETQDLLSLKIGKYNQHKVFLLNDLENSVIFFGNEGYMKMIRFAEFFEKKANEFRSCSPASLQDLSEKEWTARSAVIKDLLQERLLIVEQLKTGDDVQRYQENILAEQAAQTAQQRGQ